MIGYTLNRNSNRVTSPVYITAMRDVDDTDHHLVVDNLINDSEFASPRRVPPLELITEWLTHPMGMVRKRTSNELPARDCHGFWEIVRESPFRRLRQLHAIGHRGGRPAARISCSTSSRVNTSPRSASASAWRISPISC